MADMIRSIDLQSVIDELKLEADYLPCEAKQIQIRIADVGRSGLPLTGYFEHFEPERIQILGKAEYSYLASLPEKEANDRLTDFFSHKPVTVVFTHGNLPTPKFLELSAYFEVPVLHTAQATSSFTAAIMAFLTLSLAPSITRHGVFVEVYGEGVLILGDSGVGKSETAIELIKRGHRLIADDAVELKRVSAKTIIGTAPELIRYYIELRGIGIVDVRRLFGMGAVKVTEKVELVIQLENWVQGKMYDRLGLDSETVDIMGIRIPSMTIPVRPGRNLAIIIEIAAMNNRQKRMGYNTAEEFNRKLMGEMDEADETR
jgi:HPr kinase/phosphorylase